MSRFDLVFTGRFRSWFRADFDECRIENCYFRGGQIRGSFIAAEIIKSDFSPAGLFPGDRKTDDPRLDRLGSFAPAFVVADEDVFTDLIRANKNELDEFAPEARRAWDKASEAIRKRADGGVYRLPLRNFIRTRLDHSIFESSVIYACPFRATQMMQRVSFDNALLLRTDFRPARIDELLWVETIITIFDEDVRAALASDEYRLIFETLQSLLRQLAERIEDQASIIVIDDDDSQHSRMCARLSTASFDSIAAGDVHFGRAIATSVRFNDCTIADSFFDYADLSRSSFDGGVLKRIDFDGADLSHSSAVETQFTGELIEGRKVLEIARGRETYEQRLHEAGERQNEALDEASTAGDDAVDGDDFGPDGEPEIASDGGRDSIRAQREAFDAYRRRNGAQREMLRAAAEYYSELERDADEDAVGAESEETAALNWASESCSFEQSILSGLKAPGASFKACVLEGASLAESDFECGEQCGAADFDFAFLRNVDFSGARLEGVSFSGATLTGAGGFDKVASLRDANFFNSKGLTGTEFAGADLSGVTMPPELESYGGILTSVAELTRQARILFATLMFVCAYSILSLVNLESGGATADAGEATLQLPVVNIGVSAAIFLAATPWLVIAFYSMFHLKFARIWLDARRLPYRFPDNRLVDRHLFPWIFASLVPLFLRRNANSGNAKKSRTPSVTSVEMFLAVVFGWLLALATLFLLYRETLRIANGRPIDTGQPELTVLNVNFENSALWAFLVGIMILLSSFSVLIRRSRQTANTERGKESKTSREEDAATIRNRRGVRALLGKAVSGAAAIWRRFWQALRTFFGRLRDIFAFAALSTAMIGAVLAPSISPGLLKLAAENRGFSSLTPVFVTTADFAGEVFVHSAPEDLAEWNGARSLARRDLRFLAGAGADLSEGDFSNSILTRPHFHTADLRGADFSGATLLFADFRAADITGASFKSASLLSVDFSRVAGADRAAFDGACANSASLLPEGIDHLPPCK